MLMVSRPVSDYGHPLPEELQLRCHRCKKRFRSLSEAWLCYQAPEPGARSEARYCHKRCVEAGTQVRLLRADFGLHRLLESLLTPAITRALRKDLPGARRPWGSP